MELKEGMYVRTKYGISQYREYDTNRGKLLCIPIKDGSIGVFANFENIIGEPSYNVAELLEVGDFLDTHCIVKIENTTIFLNTGWFIDFDDIEDLVETIVTKEQFESVQYRIGD